MANVRTQLVNDELTVYFGGRVDSANSQEIEDVAMTALQKASPKSLVLDCEGLAYISSAGLRVLLRLSKVVPRATRIANCQSPVYDIFEMTGFSEMFEVTRAMRRLSVEGCARIGEGSNGIVYRLDSDTILKAYRNPDALPEIHRERELARTAFVLGVPTAIPYDVVRVGEGYGSVFELLDASSLGELLAAGKKTVDEVADMSVELLHQIHETEVSPESMPSMRVVATEWALFLRDHLPAPLADKLCELVHAVPENNHMLHGDFHAKNVMVQNGEALLIDMDTLCHGHPVFELASTYNAYVGFGQQDHAAAEAFMGLPYELMGELWDKTLRGYLGTDDPDVLRDVEDKAALVGNARMLRRCIRRGGSPAFAEACRARLEELIPRVDSLLF